MFWSSLESIPSQRAVSAVWREYLGDAFDELKLAFLQTMPDRRAESVPCPHRCGCWHRVLASDESPLLAVCQCPTWDCDDFPLSPEDIVLWQLSWPKLRRALVAALNLDSKIADFGLRHTGQIGSWSADAVPVILTIPQNALVLRQVIAELVARLHRPFILLLPTTQFVTAASQELLARSGAEYFALADNLRIGFNGRLEPVRPPGELFAQFTPQPREAEEAAAQQAFALVRRLEEENPRRVTQLSAVTVFRLYCVEGLTAEAISKKLGYSKMTVLRRLKDIEKQTGQAVSSLRALSIHLGSLGEEVSDSRARKIRPQALLDDADPEW
jgi:hypothetical protein